jgi:hypothetical protein
VKRAWPLVTLVLLAVAAGSEPGRAVDGGCAPALPREPAGLPAPVLVTTGCGRFRLEPNGGVVYEGPGTSPVPPEALSYWMDFTWFGVANDHLLVGRGLSRLWRSHDTYPGTYPGDVGAVALGRTGLALSYVKSRRSSLYLAGYGEAERVIARGETPVTFTGSGDLVTWRARGKALLLRDGSGHFERRLAVRAMDPQVDRESGMVLFRVRNRLVVFDGLSVRDLVTFRKLGLRGFPTVEALGSFVAVHDQRRLVVLGYNGRLIASTALPRRTKRADGVSGSVVLNTAGTAVAFPVTRGNTATGSRGRETVYVLAAGERRARPLFSAQLDFKECERIAWLAWRGRWLLYANTEQQGVVIDSFMEMPPIELGNVIAELPGFSTDETRIFDIAWAS